MHDSQSLRRDAIRLLGDKGEPKDLLSTLLTCLGDPSNSIKREALDTIIADGLKADAVRDGMLKAMSTSLLLSRKVNAALESFDNVEPAALLDAMTQAAKVCGGTLVSSHAASVVFDICCQRAVDQSRSELDRVICIRMLKNHVGASEEQIAQRQEIFDKCIASDSPVQIRYAVMDLLPWQDE